jgi:MFS family permease
MRRYTPSFLVLILFFLTGLLQGIGFTTIPAAGNFIASPQGFAFDSEQYGALFLPMFAGAIFASFFGGSIAKKVGIKKVFITGQICNILSMALFALNQAFIQTPSFSFPLFLILMLFLGTGFGAALTSLNAFAFFFFPARPKTALTALHSCLGIGTAIGPITFIFFLSKGLWWWDAVMIGAFYLLFLIAISISFPNPKHLQTEPGKQISSRLPLTSLSLWGFIAIAFLYGLCETTFGNWGTIFLHLEKQLNMMDAAFALSIFWGVVTLGRILTVFLSLILPNRYIYCALPLLMLFSLFLLYPATKETLLLTAFAVAGLGCSAMLPLTIGFAQERFKKVGPFVSGVTMGVYMLGFGVASQGIGLLYQVFHFAYSMLFASLSVPILLLFVLCLFVTHQRKKHRYL